MIQKTISVPEAGRALGVGPSLSYRLAKAGQIPVLRLGRKLRVPLAALEEMLKNPMASMVTDEGNADGHE